MEDRAGIGPARARADCDSATEPQLSVYGRGITANCGGRGAWNAPVIGGFLKGSAIILQSLCGHCPWLGKRPQDSGQRTCLGAGRARVVPKRPRASHSPKISEGLSSSSRYPPRLVS